MLRRLGSNIRNQWAGFLSLFLVLTGGVAYAANTIGSADIIDESILSRDVKNGQVGTADLAADAVRGVKVLDESLTGHDIKDDTIGGADVNETLLDPLTSPQIEDESLTGHDIQDDTIGGADVNESLLDGVPYSPAYASHNPADFDLPHDSSYAQVIYTGDGNHGDPLVHVQVPGLVMASANLTFYNPYGGDTPRVSCELGLVTPGGPRTSIGLPAFIRLNTGDIATIPLSGALRVTQPGDYYVNVVCKDDGSTSSNFSASFWQGNLIAWAM